MYAPSLRHNNNGDTGSDDQVWGMRGYRALPACLPAIIFLANSAKVWRFRTLWRWYSCETLLQRLPQHFEHVPSALGACIEAEDAVVGPRPLARQGHLPAPISPTSAMVWWWRGTAGR